MGLFDFVKDAGTAIFGKDDKKKQAEADLPPVRTKEIALADRAKGETLTKLVSGMGLGVHDVAVKFRDGVATLTGTADSQAERERAVLLIGNTQGVARVDDRLTVETPAPEATFHTVVSGDTLSKIAKTYYGNASKYMTIFEANKPMLTDPNKIYVGQTLRIPPLD